MFQKIERSISSRLFLDWKLNTILPLIIFLVISNLVIFFFYYLQANFLSSFSFFFDNPVLAGILATVFLIVFGFSISPIDLLKTQFRWNRPSWVWYAMWAIMTQPLITSLYR